MKIVLPVIFGVVLGSLLVWVLTPLVAARFAQPEQGATEVDLGAMRAELERLRGIAPTQSHVMADAGAQFSSLWFAAQSENWELATFLFNETRGRIRWTVRINPKPKAAGSEEEVDLQGLFEALDKDLLTPLKEAIDAHDSSRFEIAYRETIEGCIACHKSTNRAFLRPTIPTAPGLSILSFAPDTSSPQ